MAISETGRGGKRALVFGLLFGGVFAAVGLGVLFFLVVPTLLDAHAARSWVPARAFVEATALERSRSSSSGSRTNSQTYRVTVRYRYVFDGQEHRGERVGLTGGSDNIGDWQQRWHNRLHQAMEGGEPIAIYVNPADPAQSIVDREIRWGELGFLLIFPVAFGGAGIGITVVFVRGFFGSTRQPRPARLAQAGESSAPPPGRGRPTVVAPRTPV